MKKKTARKKHVRGKIGAFWGIGILVFLIFLIIFGKLQGFLGGVIRADAGDNILKRQASWDGKGLLNLAVKSDQVYVLSLNPVEKSLTIFKVPDDAYLDLPLNFGRWPARSVYELGQAENPPMGAGLLRETISSVFGIPADGYLILDDSRPLAQRIKDIQGNPLSWPAFISKARSDLSLFEMTNFLWQLKGIRFDKINTMDLSQSKITTKITVPDGSQASMIDQLKLDQFIQGKLEDPTLKDEALSIGIFNATDHPGLAEKAARIITNMGGRVVFTSNYKALDKTLVLGKKSYTFSRAAKIFAPSCLGSSCKVSSSDNDFSRADVNILLGEDYFLRYNR